MRILAHKQKYMEKLLLVYASGIVPSFIHFSIITSYNTINGVYSGGDSIKSFNNIMFNTYTWPISIPCYMLYGRRTKTKS